MVIKKGKGGVWGMMHSICECTDTRLGNVTMDRGMYRDVARGSIGSTILFLILVLVNLIRSGSRLTVHDSMGVSTGFVN